MKKLVAMLLVMAVLIGTGSRFAMAREECKPYQGMKKIMWGEAELKKGQIGRLEVIKQTSLFKIENGKKVFSRNLKAKETFRIYNFLQGMLGLGGGYYIDQNEKVKYETPSASRLKAVSCLHNKQEPIEYILETPKLVISKTVKVDGSNSLFFYDYKSWIVYDKSQQVLKSVPFPVNDYPDPGNFHGTKDYLFSLIPDKGKDKLSMFDLYRTELNNNRQTIKLVEDVQGMNTDGHFLYYTKANRKEQANGVKYTESITLYRSNLDGREEVQIKKLPWEYGSLLLFAESGEIYFYYHKYDYDNNKVGVSELRKLTVATGEFTSLGTVDFPENGMSYRSIGDYFMTLEFPQSTTDFSDNFTVYTKTGMKKVSFKHNRYFSKFTEYNGKFYLLNDEGNLYEIDKNGKFRLLKNIIKKPYHTVEGYLEGNILYTFESIEQGFNKEVFVK